MNDPDSPAPTSTGSATHPLVAFYLGQIPTHGGHWFEDILAWDDARLESVHDYIQWLFPLWTHSAFASDAPTLDEVAVAEFRANPFLRGRLLQALRRMLGFYGLRYDEPEPGEVYIERDEHFDARARLWLTPGNHNYRRLTRILTSLRITGLHAHALALFECLEEIHRAHGGRIGQDAMRHWQQALR